MPNRIESFSRNSNGKEKHHALVEPYLLDVIRRPTTKVEGRWRPAARAFLLMARHERLRIWTQTTRSNNLFLCQRTTYSRLLVDCKDFKTDAAISEKDSLVFPALVTTLFFFLFFFFLVLLFCLILSRIRTHPAGAFSALVAFLFLSFSVSRSGCVFVFLDYLYFWFFWAGGMLPVCVCVFYLIV